MKVDFHRERLRVLLELEQSFHYKTVDYLSVEPLSADASSSRRRAASLRPDGHRDSDTLGFGITVSHRQTMGEWFFKATDYLNLSRDIGALSLKYFDMFLARRSLSPSSVPRNHRDFQILALACLFLSIKLFAADQGFTARTLCSMTGCVVEPFKIVSMEYSVLQTLDWHIHPPLPTDFFQSYITVTLMEPFEDENDLSTNTARDDIIDRAHYLMELSALDYFFVEQDIAPSYIGLSALSIAMDMVLPLDEYKDPFVIVKNRLCIQLDQARYELCRHRFMEVFLDSLYEHDRMPSPTSVVQDVLAEPSDENADKVDTEHRDDE